MICFLFLRILISQAVQMTTHFMIHAILKKRSYYKNFLSGYRMKSNAEKCHLIMSSNEPVDFLWGSSIIVRSDFEEILGVKTDYKINFDEYVKNLCSKANNKLKAWVRASSCMIVEKKKEKCWWIYFFNTQFNYCPFITQP